MLCIYNAKLINTLSYSQTGIGLFCKVAPVKYQKKISQLSQKRKTLNVDKKSSITKEKIARRENKIGN